MMRTLGVGLLRTMGGADRYRITPLQAAARGLGVPWPDVTASPASSPRSTRPCPAAALIEEARDVMGHAGYAYFEGAPPAGAEHAGVAALYAHTTAPLRRLADRYVLDLVARRGDREALRRLPDVMASAGSRAARVERAIVDDAEVWLLEHRVGERFDAVALENDRRAPWSGRRAAGATRLHADPSPAAGDRVSVTLVRADPASRSLEFGRRAVALTRMPACCGASSSTCAGPKRLGTCRRQSTGTNQ